MADQKKQKEKKDLKETLTAALIPKLTSLVVNLIPEKTYNQLFRDHTVLIEIAGPALGLFLKKVTNLTDDQDDFITELFQEFSQSVGMRNMKKANVEYSAKDIDRLQKGLENLFSDNVKKKVNNAFQEFENLMNEVHEDNKEAVLTALSNLNPKAFANFLSSTPEEKKNFLSFFLKEKKVEEKKESSDLLMIFKGFKNFVQKFDTELNKTFDDNSELRKFSKSFRERAEEFNKKTKNERKVK